MKNKRDLFMAVFVMVLFIAAALPVFGSAEEYKVVKNALQSKEHSEHPGEITWFKLEVTDKTSNKATVKIKIPVSLVEMLCDNEKEDKVEIAGKCKVDLKRVLGDLKKNGPMTLIEVDDEKETVKIWFE